ncbi:hypothetical protein MNBD_ALPHA04-645 [hydrothermal vent metagenome]|uniref:Uncharacterized protein n=1 Tax=hydrothermal vent metagenome TaxID=652676 RepID=A0A3B0R6U0_9ZZZZ
MADEQNEGKSSDRTKVILAVIGLLGTIATGAFTYMATQRNDPQPTPAPMPTVNSGNISPTPQPLPAPIEPQRAIIFQLFREPAMAMAVRHRFM